MTDSTLAPGAGALADGEDEGGLGAVGQRATAQSGELAIAAFDGATNGFFLVGRELQFGVGSRGNGLLLIRRPAKAGPYTSWCNWCERSGEGSGAGELSELTAG